MKVDIFIAERDERSRTQLDRRRAVDVGGHRLWFYSIEDIVVRKLSWFRLGDERPDSQWRDVVGIQRLRRQDVDQQYLRRAAEAFGVLDLLERAIGDSI